MAIAKLETIQRVGPFVFLSLLYSASAFAQKSTSTIDFTQQIQPIFASRCAMCHSQEKRSGGLSLASYADALDGGRSGSPIRPGRSAKSLIVQRITGETQPQMPFGLTPLSDSQIALVKTWIDEGARPAKDAPPATPKWEATLALTQPPVPASPWSDWSRPADRFVAAYLSKNGVSEPQLVSDERFARRAYLDIWGLLPPPGELERFVNDKSPNKRNKLVTRLLADNTKYAENWISFWNDLLRNDEGVNYYSETASRKSITPWLLASLRSNLPYDRFVNNLIDPVTPTDPDGFLIGVNWRGTVSASQTPALQAAQNTAQIFLGINLKCNSCHDSFISKWKLKDAYSLASYFSEQDKLELYRCDVAQHKYAKPGFLYPELDRQLPSDSTSDRRATAAAIFTDPRNGRLPRTLVNRFWERLLGRGIVANVDEMDGEPWSPELLDWLAADFASHNYDMKRLIGTIVSSKAYQLAAIENKGEQPKHFVFRGPEIRRLTAEEFADAVGSITGDWHIAPPAAKTVSKASAPKPLQKADTSRSGLVFQKVAYKPGTATASAPVTQVSRAGVSDIEPGTYSRDWRIAADSMTRALGRPIRDQVFSTRDNQATTLQAIELENGETLTHWLSRGSRRLVGQLPPEPRSLFAAQIERTRDQKTAMENVDVDISKSSKLVLIVQDASSTAPDKAAPIWSAAELVGPKGQVPLSSLKPLNESDLRTTNARSSNPISVKLSSILAYDIAGKGFTRFRSMASFDDMNLALGESARARFFVFDQQPSLDRLVPPYAATPLPAPQVLKTKTTVENWVFQYALGRLPTPTERQVADAALTDTDKPSSVSSAGLADLLWAVLMKPEFQLIY